MEIMESERMSSKGRQQWSRGHKRRTHGRQPSAAFPRYAPDKIKVVRSTGLASDGSPRTLLWDVLAQACYESLDSCHRKLRRN